MDLQGVSLARLLSEVRTTPEVLSRKYYVSLYVGTAVEDLANKDFDRFSGIGGPHIDPAVVEADLATLRSTLAKCEEFADKRVAHHDTREPKSPPTFNEVDAAVELLDRLYVRYLLAFKANAMDTLLPTWQYDWKSIFRTPWIEPTD